MEKNDFIDTIGKLAQDVNRCMNKHILPSICIAQACQETGYGKSTTMLKYNAPFGIKAGNSWTGACYNTTTHEYYENVKVAEGGCFRAYPDLRSAVADYYKLLTTSSYYAGVVDNPDYKSAVMGLSAYATDPNYLAAILKIIEMDNLIRYDSPILSSTFDLVAETLKTIQGVYGNGENRKRALGTNYQTVQENINRILALAKDTAKGKYGNGTERKNILGPDYELVQFCINNHYI